MTRITINQNQLREMIGLYVHYHGVFCQVVEILDDGPTLVLIDLEAHISIQADQHGEAHRKVPKTYAVNILSPDQVEFSGAFLALEPLEAEDVPPHFYTNPVAPPPLPVDP